MAQQSAAPKARRAAGREKPLGASQAVVAVDPNKHSDNPKVFWLDVGDSDFQIQLWFKLVLFFFNMYWKKVKKNQGNIDKTMKHVWEPVLTVVDNYGHDDRIFPKKKSFGLKASRAMEALKGSRAKA